MINDLLRNDIIQKSTSEYANPIVLVKKKDDSDRLCVDYRRLNQHMVKEVFPTPNIEERLQDIKRFTYFTVLDMNSGYYQNPIEENSRKFTAFVTPDGLYEFKRMPFVLKNAQAVFQGLMPSFWCTERIRFNGQYKICEFMEQTIEFLGHQIHPSGISPSKNTCNSRICDADNRAWGEKIFGLKRIFPKICTRICNYLRTFAISAEERY